ALRRRDHVVDPRLLQERAQDAEALSLLDLLPCRFLASPEHEAQHRRLGARVTELERIAQAQRRREADLPRRRRAEADIRRAQVCQVFSAPLAVQRVRRHPVVPEQRWLAERRTRIVVERRAADPVAVERRAIAEVARLARFHRTAIAELGEAARQLQMLRVVEKVLVDELARDAEAVERTPALRLVVLAQI